MFRRYRVELLDLDGTGARRTHVYQVPAAGGYWEAVTDILCPACGAGMITWHEAGFVPGYRICNHCRRHFIAAGNLEAPVLRRVGARRGGPRYESR
jgi:hypothetical protein